MRKLGKLVFIVGVLVGAAGCKQGLGDRCQTSDDCQSGLVCSTGQHQVCTDTATAGAADASTGVGGDAPIIYDAPFIPDALRADARVPDAPIPDAPIPDAPIPSPDAAQALPDAPDAPEAAPDAAQKAR